MNNRQEKEKSCKKRKRLGTHSIFKFNKMIFLWQNLEVSDVLATDIVEFLISRKMERFQMMKVMSKLRPIVKVVQTAVS